VAPERPLTPPPSAIPNPLPNSPSPGSNNQTPDQKKPLEDADSAADTAAYAGGTVPMSGAMPMTPYAPGSQGSHTGGRGFGAGGWVADTAFTGPGVINPLNASHPNQDAIDTTIQLLRYVLDSDWTAKANYPAGIRPSYAIAAHADPDEIVHYFFFTNQGRGWIPPGVVVPRVVQLGWETVPPIGRGVLLGRSDPGLQALRHFEATEQHYSANGQRYRLIAVSTSLEIGDELNTAILRANDKIVGDIALAPEPRFVDPGVSADGKAPTDGVPLQHRLQMVAPEAHRRIVAMLAEKAELAPLAIELAIDTVEASFAYDRPAFLDIVGALKRSEPITEVMSQALREDITTAVTSAEIERSQQEAKRLEDQKLIKYASDHTRVSAGIALTSLLEGDEESVLDIAYEHYATNARPDKISEFINQFGPQTAKTE
jgi:hypothetical protein